MTLSPKQRARLRFARARWAAWLEHVDECVPCRSPNSGCVRGRSLDTAWQVARDLTTEGEEAPQPRTAEGETTI